MAIKLQHSNTFSTYFITFTCIEWIHLFEMVNAYDMVYKWFAAVKRAYNAEIVAYVIMPNYLHVILHFHDEIFNLNTSVANGKRIIAYEIINRLEQAGNNELLNRLKKMVTERERKKGQLHKVFKTLLMQRQLLPMRF